MSCGFPFLFQLQHQRRQRAHIVGRVALVDGQLYENRRDPKLTEEGQTYLENIDRYGAGRLRRLVNYNKESAPVRLWCELENKFWFFMTKVFRHYIWKPKVRALLEEARIKTEKGEC